MTELEGLAKLSRLERELEALAAWARQPVDDARRMAADFGHAARRLDVGLVQLRVLAAAALGEADQRTAADRAVERRPQVQVFVARLRKLGVELDQVRRRARDASRRAIQLAILGPELTDQACAQLAHHPAGPERDATGTALLGRPMLLKRRAETIRSEALRLPAEAADARRSLVQAWPRGTGAPRRARVPTDKLTPIRGQG
jgi:hypothetical protein